MWPCSFACGTDQALWRHMIRKHKAKPNFSSRYCQKISRRERYFHGHVNTDRDSKPKPHTCAKCEKTFSYKSSLPRHAASCAEKQKLECAFYGEQCLGHRFPRVNTAKLHRQTDRQNCSFMSHSHHIYLYNITNNKKGTSHLDLRATRTWLII